VGGLVAMAGGYAGLGLLAHDGVWHDALMLPLLAIAGAGLGAGYSPVLARTLRWRAGRQRPRRQRPVHDRQPAELRARRRDIGSQFLDRVHAPTALESGRAFALALAMCGALGLLAALMAVMLAVSERHAVRRRATAAVPSPGAAVIDRGTG
jgi:hypothetical protein